ncbi:MAG: HAMP domain-containing protein [Candidatus Latescibacteria bacterium]|nr:HAMP domain-containing protein [Candidatus Latescibacterota bacterium]
MAVVVLISTISTILTFLFIVRQKKILTDELHARVRSIAQNLAYNSRDYILKRNAEQLYALTKGVIQEKDIERAQIINSKGKIIGHYDWRTIGEEFSFPVDSDSLSEETWFPSELDNCERVIVPIDIEGKFFHRDSNIIYSSGTQNADQDSAIFLPCIFIFPCFSHNGQEVTFSSLKYDHGNKIISSINIYNFKHKILVDGFTHGRWSHDGKLLTFSREEEIAVYNTSSNEIHILCTQGIGRIGYPCFTHDDESLITTLQANPPDINSERLFRISLDGGESEQLTYHKGQHWWPDCSPDGKWILYSDILDFCLYIYHIETGVSVRLFPDLSRKHCGGSFSPDGQKIGYLMEKQGNYEVFITNYPIEKEKQTPDTVYGTQLTSNGRNKWMPTDWSPDGKWITYVQNWEIYIIPAIGGNPINLTESLAGKEIIGYIVLDISFESMQKVISEGTKLAILMTLILIGLGTLGTVLVVKKLVLPLHNLAEATQEIAQGNFDQSVSVTRNDEIGILAESFNKMIGHLQNYQNKIETWNRELGIKVIERTQELAEKHVELEKAYKELETLDTAKDDFLSLVSHEIRTPLASISLHAEMLLNGIVDSEENKKLYHINIVKGCERLTRLVNNVLDISKIDAGRMQYNFEALNIRDLIDEVVKTFRPIIDRKRIQLKHNLVDGNIRFRGDRDRII